MEGVSGPFHEIQARPSPGQAFGVHRAQACQVCLLSGSGVRARCRSGTRLCANWRFGTLRVSENGRGFSRHCCSEDRHPAGRRGVFLATACVLVLRSNLCFNKLHLRLSLALRLCGRRKRLPLCATPMACQPCPVGESRTVQREQGACGETGQRSAVQAWHTGAPTVCLGAPQELPELELAPKHCQVWLPNTQ